MRLNKVMKSLAIVVPLMALAACGSSSKMEEDSQSSTNAQAQQQAQQQAAAEQKNIQVTAAQREQKIAEQKRKELDKLRSEHIIHFDFDVSTIPSEYLSVLDAHAKFLGANENVKVLIEGHADERGTPEYNIALGERRGKAISTYLENMGVSSSQISVVSYGEEKPMVKNRSEAAFAKNRRAVIVY